MPKAMALLIEQIRTSLSFFSLYQACLSLNINFLPRTRPFVKNINLLSYALPAERKEGHLIVLHARIPVDRKPQPDNKQGNRP